MPTESPLTPMQRRDAALAHLDAGQESLRQALAGLDADEAFLGSRWSVWEVLQHLDAESFVDALERIAAGQQDMLPPFTSREERLRQDLEHLESTFQRLRAVMAGLTAEQLARPATPPNPANAFPGLTLLELIERTAGHAATHAQQIAATRQYVAAFNAKERAVTVLALGETTEELSRPARELLAFADYAAGEPAALEWARPWLRGLEIVIRPDNQEEVAARLGRETRAGLWTIICVSGRNPAATHPELLQRLRHHCPAVHIVG